MVERKERERTNISESKASTAWILGDDVSTDDIILGKYLEIRDSKILCRHVLESLLKGFCDGVRPGDVIIAGENFGCGSSREQAPALLKDLGIGLILAKSFSRIFFRNAINIGLPLNEIDDEIYKAFSTGDRVSYSIDPPKIVHLSKKIEFRLKRMPEFFINILKSGGAIALLQKEMKKTG
ncbi:MAG: LeuD/DmdB family oxidoreductase small subunit [Promethearchaeota archaeon]